MAFRRKIDDIIEIILGEQARDQFPVADIALYKNMAGIPLHILEVFQIARISQLIQIDQQDILIFTEHIMHEVAADKAGATCD